MHILLAPALDAAQLGILEGEGAVLLQPAAALPVALHGHQDHLPFAFQHIALHAPGGAEGSIVIKENVLPVKEVHDGVAPFQIFPIALGNVHIGPAGLVAGQLGDGQVPSNDHK